MSLLHISKNIRHERSYNSRAGSSALNGRHSVRAKHIFANNSALLVASFVCIGLIAFLSLYLKSNIQNQKSLNSESQTPSTNSPQTSTTDNSPFLSASTQQNNQSTGSRVSPNTSDDSVSTNVAVSNSSGSNGQSASSAQMSINGQPVTMPTNGGVVHTTTSSPDQSTSLTVTSNHVNGSVNGFTNTDADVYVNSSSITVDQEGD